MIIMHFTRGTGLVPRVIQWITWSDVTHVALEVNGHVYEANHSDGVKKTTAIYWKHANKAIRSIQLNHLNDKVILKRLENEVGKKYDFANLFCYPFRCDYQHKNRWTCSELISYAIQELVPHQHYHRVAPRHLLSIAHAASYKDESK